MQDNEIVGLYFARSEDAISRSDEKYGRYLKKIAENILGDPEDSREVVNLVWMSAWNSIPPLRPVSLKGWLSAVAREKAIDLLRRSTAAKRGAGQYETALDELSDCLPGGYEPEEKLVETELTAAVNSFLKALPEKDRNIFMFRYFFCDPLKDISDFTGFSEGKIKSILFRTRAKLKIYLEKEGFDL